MKIRNTEIKVEYTQWFALWQLLLLADPTITYRVKGVFEYSGTPTLLWLGLLTASMLLGGLTVDVYRLKEVMAETTFAGAPVTVVRERRRVFAYHGAAAAVAKFRLWLTRGRRTA